MKYLLAIITLFSVNTAFAFSTGIEPDKELHLGVSFALSAMTYAVLQDGGESTTKCFWGAVGFTMAAGIMKELADDAQPMNKFDWNDVKYDAIGAVTGALLVWSFP